MGLRVPRAGGQEPCDELHVVTAGSCCCVDAAKMRGRGALPELQRDVQAPVVLQGQPLACSGDPGGQCGSMSGLCGSSSAAAASDMHGNSDAAGVTKLLSYLIVTLLTSLLVSIHTVRTGIGSSQHVLSCECRGWGVAGFTF